MKSHGLSPVPFCRRWLADFGLSNASAGTSGTTLKKLLTRRCACGNFVRESHLWQRWRVSSP